MPDFLTRRLDKIRAENRFRELPGTVEGVDFWSNDYLGMARTRVQGEVEGAVQPPNHKTGATGSRLISGDADAYHATEQMIAAFHGCEAALVYNSGYTANLGLLSAILKRGDTILYDELVHASCRDGLRLGLGRAYKFGHNDPEEMLRRTCADGRTNGEVFVLTEARFSMDGDLAPLQEMADLCARYGAHLIVDEAHSVGLEGPQGAGLVAQLGLQDKVFATIVTYGKAPGAHGAAVLGSAALRDYLVNTSRPFIYTTGPSPEQWRAIAGAYARLETEQEARYQQLCRVISHFKDRVNATGLGAFVPDVDGPIQTVTIPGNGAVMAAEAACREAGLLVKGIRSPTVSAGAERLRICLHSFNTEGEVRTLVETLIAIS
jgi:8-amino-7-oxononanoate synthase